MAMANRFGVRGGGRRRPFGSLRLRMVLIFAGVVVLTLVLASGVSGYIAHAALYSHAATDREHQEQRLTRFAALMHESHRSWGPVEEAVASIGPVLGRHVIILDDAGNVVADSGRRGRGAAARLGPEHISVPTTDSAAISDQRGDTIGYLLMRDAPGQQFDPPAVSLVQQNINKSLLAGGVAAGLVGIVIVGLMATRMLRPLAQLNQAAVRVGRGELSERVPVRGPSEIRGLATAFNNMAEDLERSDIQRRNLTADVAHELRTPLSNIRGYLEAIKDGVLPADPGTIDTLHQQSTHLSQLVDDLALLARAEAGALTLDVQRVSLSQIAQGSLEAFRARATAAGVTLEQEMPGDLPDVSVDPRRVSQIIDNLLENAITHTPAGGTVTVATNVMENWGGGFDGVYVAVSDTGAGIRAEDLEYVFDRFYRTDPSRSRTTGGSGLGLTIARQLAIAQGGQLTVESVVGEGSRFTLTLPVEG